MNKLLIYQVFVRNYSQEGTFRAVMNDLARIKDLGTDILYLMPIHPIGELNRKGTYGSPYAIKDYFAISPDLGTKEDFLSLINKTHQLGMKIIIDIVFHHTSPDNILVNAHPEYYFYRNGKRGNHVGDWSDIVDLDVTREDTQDYLISVLKYWISLGVDGFRFDVASMIPMSFYRKARKELGNKPIFFGECIERDFAKYLIDTNSIYVDDKTLSECFDYLYNYNYMDVLTKHLKGECSLEDVVQRINEDDDCNTRVNCLENHDISRIASYFDNEDDLFKIVEFIFSLKGHLFLYMGQEYGIKHKPELFEKDPVIWPKENSTCKRYKELIKAYKNRT